MAAMAPHASNAIPVFKDPTWLSEIDLARAKHGPLPLDLIVPNSLFYPGSGIDGDPIKYLSHSTNSFVYCDYRVSEAHWESELSRKCFRGYTLKLRRQLASAKFWRTLDAFICPSDPASRASAPAATVLGRNNYRACAGDRPEHDQQAPSQRGMFSGWLVNRTAAHVKDGLSNTVACGEVCVATGTNSIRGSMAVGWGVGNAATAPLTSMIPQTCAARQGLNGQLSGTVDSTMSGSRWSDGVSAFASLHTILPPNTPSCREGNDFRWVVATASSYHPGGANVSMADGSVRFVVESIDTGRLTDRPVNSGRSPYGVWGAMGSIDGGESSFD